MKQQSKKHVYVRMGTMCGVFIVAIVVLALGVAMPLQAQETSQVALSKMDQCAQCHVEQVKKFAATSHTALDSAAFIKRTGKDISCANCHGDVAAHIDKGGGKGSIFAFSKTDAANAKSKICLTCHSDNHGSFFASNHAKAGMDCTSCHDVHEAKGMGHGKASCTTCHADVASKFKLNERHRLKEGILACTSCHNPHEAAQRERLGGFKQEECFKCHTDKQGPYLYEHGANTREGCTACHEPHGSVNRHMLTYQNVADLCFSCHARVPSFHTRFSKETKCTNCHSSIHGSNLSPTFIH